MKQFLLYSLILFIFINSSKAQQTVEKKSFSERMLYYQKAKSLDFGPKIGISTSTLIENTETLGDSKIKTSLMGGFFSRYMISERVLSEVSINYVSRGAIFNNTSLRIDAIEIPLVLGYNVRYTFFNIPMTFDAFAGLQPSLHTRIKSSDHSLENMINTNTIDFVFGSGFPMGKWMFYSTNKIGITNSFNDKSKTHFLRNLSTDWWMAYRF